MTPSDVGLPYSAWGPGQLQLVLDILDAFTQAPYVVVEAPTGTGKSGVAMAVAKLLSDETIIVTGTKQLQRQYAEMFPSGYGTETIREITGRANHQCLIEPKDTAETAICTVGGRCEFKGTSDCDYYAQFQLTGQTPVLNYSMWLAQINFAGRFKEPSLVICDEAHSLEEEIRKFATCWVGDAVLHELHLDKPLDMRGWIAWAGSTERTFRKEVQNIRSSNPEDVPEMTPGLVLQRRRTLRLYATCQMLLTMPDPDAWVSIPLSTGTQFRPVWVNTLAGRFVFRHTPRALLMSGTILSKEMYCADLGLDPAKVQFLRVPSVFPKSNRPLYYRPVGKVKAADELSLQRLVESVDDILASYPDQKGLIHTGSYKVANYIRDHSKFPERLWGHDGKTRISALEAFKSDPEGVLVSPSMTTGVDLPYDLCRFQIIAKLSFPDLGDPQVKKRMKLGPDGNPNPKGQSWYNWITACTLVQTYGRGMRAIDDSCDTYLLDGNWGWFKHTVKDMLPPWFREAIINQIPTSPGVEDVAAQIKRWAAEAG